MRYSVSRCALLGCIALVLSSMHLVSPARAADAQVVEIPVVLPLTGPAAGIGQELQKSLEIAERRVNESGGIRKRNLRFVFLDDQGQPQIAVQITNQIKAQKNAVMIGAALSALCKSMMPLVADQGPVLYCLTPAVVPATGSYVFAVNSPSRFEMQTALRFLHDRGLTRLAFITSTDASGQEADQNIAQGLQLPDNQALSEVAHERFNPADLSVTGQIAQIKASNAQAVLLWGSPVVLGTALHSMHDAGLDIPVVVTQSLMSYNSMDQLASFLPRELYFPSSFWNATSILSDGPQRRQLQDVYSRFHAAGIPLDFYQILPWDAAMIVVDALKQVGPDASSGAIRSAIAMLHNYSGVDGLYDFRTGDQRGLGLKDMLMYQWLRDAREWRPVTASGGAPLKRP
jgi:branched-chain amino acid transport system substrate-binding protein